MTPGPKDLPLACPCALKCALRRVAEGYLCTGEACPHAEPPLAFPMAGDLPVLISELRTDTVCTMTGDKTYVERRGEGGGRLRALLHGVSETTRRNCARFVDALTDATERPRVLVIGGGERGSGTQALWEDDRIEVHSVDIYPSDNVDVICDGHYLPFADASYDGVWIQAVLEHVVEPQAVVAEIHRVLRPGGLVYAETPFMQQVHEGAYDFTRFTVLGHRYLFRRFDAIDLGGNKGPEVALAWSVRYFVWAVTRSRRLARITGLATGLVLRPFGRLASGASMFDAASGVYFLGARSDGPPITHKALVSLYRGQFPR